MTNLELQISKDRVNAAYEECRRNRTEHGAASGRSITSAKDKPNDHDCT